MNKTEMLHVRISPAEARALRALAAAELLKTSETVRAVIRCAAKERGLWPPPQDAIQVQARETAQ
jgi:hypothetical protein